MSIEIVTFPGAPTVDEECVRKEAELDARIESLVQGKKDTANLRKHVLSKSSKLSRFEQ